MLANHSNQQKNEPIIGDMVGMDPWHDAAQPDMLANEGSIFFAGWPRGRCLGAGAGIARLRVDVGPRFSQNRSVSVTPDC